jgi:hypothetical protein
MYERRDGHELRGLAEFPCVEGDVPSWINHPGLVLHRPLQQIATSPHREGCQL